MFQRYMGSTVHDDFLIKDPPHCLKGILSDPLEVLLNIPEKDS